MLLNSDVYVTIGEKRPVTTLVYCTTTALTVLGTITERPNSTFIYK